MESSAPNTAAGRVPNQPRSVRRDVAELVRLARFIQSRRAALLAAQAREVALADQVLCRVRQQLRIAWSLREPPGSRR